MSGRGDSMKKYLIRIKHIFEYLFRGRIFIPPLNSKYEWWGEHEDKK